MDNLNDKAFLKQLKSGDDGAFDLLFKSLAPSLLRFVTQKFGVKFIDAEEIVADTFLRVHKAVQGFEPRQAKFTTWVFQIAKNLTLDYLRKNRPVEETLTEEIENTLAHQAYELPVENESAPTERIARAQRALMTLNQTDQDILLMRQKMSYGEIAAYINEEEGTLRTRYNRAKKKFLAAFESEGSNE